MIVYIEHLSDDLPSPLPVYATDIGFGLSEFNHPNLGDPHDR